MKKVLIVTYYWPPLNSAGVYRWLKFVKYLRDFSWEPVVYTIERKSSDSDRSLLADIPEDITVLTRPIFDPFDVYQAFLGKNKKSGQPGFLKEKEGSNTLRNLLFRIRGNFFIPDAKKFWVKPSVKFLSKYIQDNNIAAVISTGPPHSMHLIGLRLKKKTGVKWLADFRDPWTNIDFYERLGLTKKADRKHKRLEKTVVEKADEVVSVSWAWAEQMEKDHGRKVWVVTNGFDELDFEHVVRNRPEKFTIVQTGSMNEDRNPQALWDALNKLFEEVDGSRERVLVKLIGPVDHDVESAYKQAGLNDVVERFDLMQHDKAVQEMMNASMLLLPINDAKNMAGIIPGKLYEYLRASAPIVCIGAPNGDCARIIEETNAGSVHHHNDIAGVFEILRKYFEDFHSGKAGSEAKNIDQYERKNLTRDLAKILNGI